ncbi:2-oxoglutarate and iron-dependent oxygenase domain-containing protein, partial [Streptomyces sp. NPDC041003]|uniref:2-oxoglutarate and iron-dependent oxygenase domain-containing protein n=1 Tax=Streptomyces sp. NPDC041003 TaxID=3155730 RepID=UPI0033E7ADFF
MVGSQVPVIDLGPWRSGGAQDRARTAARVDEALRAAGFLLVTGHGVDPSLAAPPPGRSSHMPFGPSGPTRARTALSTARASRPS